jgi:uncharacterized Zn-finger protein
MTRKGKYAECGLQRPYVCDTCQASFIRDIHLTAHSRSHRSEADKPFACAEANCDKRFWTRQHLNNHVKAKHEAPLHQVRPPPAPLPAN